VVLGDDAEDRLLDELATEAVCGPPGPPTTGTAISATAAISA